MGNSGDGERVDVCKIQLLCQISITFVIVYNPIIRFTI